MFVSYFSDDWRDDYLDFEGIWSCQERQTFDWYFLTQNCYVWNGSRDEHKAQPGRISLITAFMTRNSNVKPFTDYGIIKVIHSLSFRPTSVNILKFHWICVGSSHRYLVDSYVDHHVFVDYLTFINLKWTKALTYHRGESSIQTSSNIILILTL